MVWVLSLSLQTTVFVTASFFFLINCCLLPPSPGLKQPWRDQSFGATAEKLQPALSHLSYSGRPRTLPCNRQELSLEEEQHLHSIKVI